MISCIAVVVFYISHTKKFIRESRSFARLTTSYKHNTSSTLLYNSSIARNRHLRSSYWRSWSIDTHINWQLTLQMNLAGDQGNWGHAEMAHCTMSQSPRIVRPTPPLRFVIPPVASGYLQQYMETMLRSIVEQSIAQAL